MPCMKMRQIFYELKELNISPLQITYEGCSESNAPHFFPQKLFIQNVRNSSTV
jgi:hypothetical protein